MADPVGWLGLALAAGTALFWVGVSVGKWTSRVSQIGALKKRVTDLERSQTRNLGRPFVPRVTDDPGDDVTLAPGDGGTLDAERRTR